MCIVYAWRPPKDDNFLSCCEKHSLGLRTGSLTLADGALVARAARACGHGVVSGDLFLRLLTKKIESTRVFVTLDHQCTENNRIVNPPARIYKHYLEFFLVAWCPHRCILHHILFLLLKKVGQ